MKEAVAAWAAVAMAEWALVAVTEWVVVERRRHPGSSQSDRPMCFDKAGRTPLRPRSGGWGCSRAHTLQRGFCSSVHSSHWRGPCTWSRPTHNVWCPAAAVATVAAEVAVVVVTAWAVLVAAVVVTAAVAVMAATAVAAVVAVAAVAAVATKVAHRPCSIRSGRATAG